LELFVFARFHAREGQETALAQGATLIVGKDFLPAIAPTSPLSGKAIGVLQIAR
jgi:hypothetical protein